MLRLYVTLNNMKCYVCSKDFEGRADAKFCSASCRVKYQRQKKDGVPPAEISPPKDVQESPQIIKSHPKKRPKPEYMTDRDYELWDGVECKFGPCLNKDCQYRVRNT